jgi:hypothetical protein
MLASMHPPLHSRLFHPIWEISTESVWNPGLFSILHRIPRTSPVGFGADSVKTLKDQKEGLFIKYLFSFFLGDRNKHMGTFLLSP